MTVFQKYSNVKSTCSSFVVIFTLAIVLLKTRFRLVFITTMIYHSASSGSISEIGFDIYDCFHNDSV